jgi:hypothetical protein
MVIILREMIRNPALARVDICPAQFFRVTSSPVAALTSGGPPRKIVPAPLTMMASSLIAGTYAPPAVQLPITAAICGMRLADMRA